MHVSLTNKKARLDSSLAHKHANGGWAVGPNGPCRAMISNERMDVQGRRCLLWNDSCSLVSNLQSKRSDIPSTTTDSFGTGA